MDRAWPCVHGSDTSHLERLFDDVAHECRAALQLDSRVVRSKPLEAALQGRSVREGIGL
jgi:hypothetical protein